MSGDGDPSGTAAMTVAAQGQELSGGGTVAGRAPGWDPLGGRRAPAVVGNGNIVAAGVAPAGKVAVRRAEPAWQRGSAGRVLSPPKSGDCVFPLRRPR